VVAPAGFEPLLGGSGESRPLPIRVILQGFFAARIPTGTVRFRPFPTAPLENVRKATDILECNYVAVAHGLFVRAITFRMVRSLRMHATRATRPTLPPSRGRVQNLLIAGLHRVAEMVAM
jgi:hypothetical protein